MGSSKVAEKRPRSFVVEANMLRLSPREAGPGRGTQETQGHCQATFRRLGRTSGKHRGHCKMVQELL
eukprot:7245199-Pyramimonas_sp.AAC.1